MNDRPWQELMKRIRDLADGPHVRVGVFGDGAKAAVHEFGSEDGAIPERSFIRSTFQDRRPELRDMTAKIARAIILRQMTTEAALGHLGQWAAAEVKKTIVEGPHPDWPELNEAYAEKKAEAGKTKMLVDTGELLNSISYEVVA